MQSFLSSSPEASTRRMFATFIRSSIVRVSAGGMLLGGVVAGLAAITTEDKDSRFSCVLSCAICLVAFYHYSALLSLRSHKSSSHKKSSDRGAAVDLLLANHRAGVTEAAADAIRYSDWWVTLPAMTFEVHAMLGDYGHWFSSSWASALICVMLLLGSFCRFGADELVPGGSNNRDGFVRLVGLIAFVGACVCLFVVEFNLFYGNQHENRYWALMFVLPWGLYGLVALLSIVVRQFTPNYPESLSVFKDVALGSLDVWSKSAMALWVAATALGKQNAIF